MEYQDAKLVYRHYAGLTCVLSVDCSENELAMFCFIHLLIENLDEHFGGVCELDLLYRHAEAARVVDEMIVAGEVVEARDWSFVRGKIVSSVHYLTS